jgi:hypothetical protein
VVDPETGFHRSYTDRYFSDTMARESGFPYALGVPMLNEACVVNAITRWMGDDGFVKKLNLKHEDIIFQGESMRVKGKVSKKYTDKHKHLVDLDIFAECQDGRLLIKGLATVQLLSRAR